MKEEQKETDPKNTKPEKANSTIENLEAVGQIILGEIEKVGGMLTANTTAQEEGDFNIKVGKLHKEVADDLAEEESEDE